MGEQGLSYVGGGAVHMHNGIIRFEDIDDNGTTEILLSGFAEEIFEDTTWMWNGREFALVEASQ
jgi:hypothetical protein